MAASARRPRTRILRLMPLALPTSNSRFCSTARLPDTTHACSWLCLANKGLAFVVATSVRSTHVLRTHFAYHCQPRRHRFQLESVTISLQACHVNAEGCYSAFAPYHHAVILGFANHSVRLHTLSCRVSGLLLRLSAVISLFKSGQHRCYHTFDAPLRPTRHQMLLHMGSPCTRRASLTAMANLFSAFTGRPCRHSLLEPRLVSGIPGTAVHSPLHQDQSAAVGAFMFLPIGVRWLFHASPC